MQFSCKRKSLPSSVASSRISTMSRKERRIQVYLMQKYPVLLEHPELLHLLRELILSTPTRKLANNCAGSNNMSEVRPLVELTLGLEFVGITLY